MRRISNALLAFSVGVTIGACGSSVRAVSDRNDPTLPRATLGSPGWEYARTASGDFDGDGASERAVVLSRVTLRDGAPQWEDWNVWQVYVEEPTGERTYVYSAPVQRGRLEPTLTQPDAHGRRAIVLVEHTLQSVTMYEIDYDGPGNARLVAIADRTADPAESFTAPDAAGTTRR